MIPRRILWQVLLLWLLFLAVAISMGVVRDTLLASKIDALLARQLETVAVCIIIALVTYGWIRSTRITKSEAIRTGVLWVILTLAFEFGFFHFVMGRPWSVLLGDFNVLQGRLWPLVLLTSLLAPYLSVKAGHRNKS